MKYKIQWKKFFCRLAFWVLGIPINVIPIIFKHLGSMTPETFPGISTLTVLTVADLDFSFISLSVVFILFLEGFFAEENLIPIYHVFQLMCIFYSFALMILYCVFFFMPGLFSIMNLQTKVTYNLVLIGLTLLLGILCNAMFSMKARKNT